MPVTYHGQAPTLPIRPCRRLTFLTLPSLPSPARVAAAAMPRPSVTVCGPLSLPSRSIQPGGCGWEVALLGEGRVPYQLKRTANWICRGSCADLICPNAPLSDTPLSLIELIGL